MSAVPQPSLSKPDAQRIRRELERLSQEQKKALEIAMDVDISPAEQKQYDERHQEIVNLLTQLTALQARELSKLSARMVELSLQEGQRTPTLRDTVPKEHGPLLSPLLRPSSDVQKIAHLSFEDAARTETVVRAVSATRHLNCQQADGTSHPRRNQWFFTFGTRIFGPVRLAAERCVMRQRTGSLVGHLRGSAREPSS
jgi:hypothetical protein